MKFQIKSWMIGMIIWVVVMLLGGVYLLVMQNPSPAGQGWSGEAALTVIPASTATQTALPPSPTSTSTPAGWISLGETVRIEGTGGAGLRLRSSPSLEAEVITVAQDGDLYIVVEGPVEEDGYVWWNLEAAAVPSIQGWAVSEYLRLADSP